MTYSFALFLFLLAGEARPVRAADIPIPNSGFEQVVLPCTAATTCWALRSAGAWTGTGEYYTYKPPVGPGGSFPAGIPDGVNVGALNDASVSQALDAVLQPDTKYTLTYYVGARSEFSFPGYRVELLAGSGVLASDSSITPRTGTFERGVIVYVSTANPQLVGQRLGIRLTGFGRGGASNFDKISLDATPTSFSGAATQVASGGEWKTTLTLMSLSPFPNSVRVAFRADDGSQLPLPLVVTQRAASQVLRDASVDRTLAPGAMLTIESEGVPSSPVLVGWAEVTSSGPLSGFAIFRQRAPGGRDSEGTSPIEPDRSTASFSVPYDNTAGFATGVALVNETDRAVIINVVILDDNGEQIDLQAVALRPKGHTAFDIATRFPAAARRRGTIDFQNQTGGRISGLGLRFSPFGSFTSLPVVIR